MFGCFGGGADVGGGYKNSKINYQKKRRAKMFN